jgi:uncharacterized protein YndB with AHSA1/START domain
MTKKTKVEAAPDRQELFVIRDFDLPVELLFRAHTDPEVVAQWMGTKVVKLEAHKYGVWRFETSDPQGRVVFSAEGVFHDFVLNQKIVRTFQMDNPLFDVQLEILEFEKLTEKSSRLTMHLLFKSIEHRDQQLKLPFAYGLNMAHDRLQSIADQLTDISYE